MKHSSEGNPALVISSSFWLQPGEIQCCKYLVGVHQTIGLLDVRIRHHFPWVKWLLPESAAWLRYDQAIETDPNQLSDWGHRRVDIASPKETQAYLGPSKTCENFLKHFNLVAFAVQSYFILGLSALLVPAICLHCNLFWTANAAIFPRLVWLAPATHPWRAAPSWNARSHQSFLIQQNSWVLRAATAGRTSCLACHLLSKYGRNSIRIRNDRRTSIPWAL